MPTTTLGEFIRSMLVIASAVLLSVVAVEWRFPSSHPHLDDLEHALKMREAIEGLEKLAVDLTKPIPQYAPPGTRPASTPNVIDLGAGAATSVHGVGELATEPSPEIVPILTPSPVGADEGR